MNYFLTNLKFVLYVFICNFVFYYFTINYNNLWDFLAE